MTELWIKLTRKDHLINARLSKEECGYSNIFLFMSATLKHQNCEIINLALICVADKERANVVCFSHF